jgi:hypothetical protein
MANQIWRFGQRERLDSRRFGFISESSSRSACTQSEVSSLGGPVFKNANHF